MRTIHEWRKVEDSLITEGSFVLLWANEPGEECVIKSIYVGGNLFRVDTIEHPSGKSAEIDMTLADLGVTHTMVISAPEAEGVDQEEIWRSYTGTTSR